MPTDRVPTDRVPKLDAVPGDPTLVCAAAGDQERASRAEARLHLAWDACEARAGSPERAQDRLARLAAAVGPLRRVLAAIAERATFSATCSARSEPQGRP